MNEMNCKECADWLHPYLDNELGTEMAARVHNHLKNCASCKAQYDELHALSGIIRQHAPRHDMSELAQQRIFAKLPTVTPKQWFAPVISLAALAASVMLFVATPSTQDMMINEVVSSHVRSLQEKHLMDVASTDQHTVKPWFAGRLDFSPPVVDLKDKGYPLIGGRLDYINHQNAAALTYQRRKHIINLFVIPTNDADSPAYSITQRGYNIITWRKNHMEFAAVSDLNTKELSEFTQLLEF